MADLWNDWRRAPGRIALVVAAAVVASLLWNAIAGIGIALALAIALSPGTTARRR